MNDIIQETIELSDFEKWLNDRHGWLKTAAKQLIDIKRLPNNEEIAELAQLCKLEAAKLDSPKFKEVAPGAFSASAIQRQIRIEQVDQVFGVNAIKQGASLPFGKGNLTLIYGQNGSGKSGFSRLLKQFCGSRSKDEITPNVFSIEGQACTAQCQITIDGNPRNISWQPGTEPHAMLKYAQVFDSKTANRYMGHTESSYEPSSMKFISMLIKISGLVSSELGKEKNSLISTLPQFPVELSDTIEQAWLSTLKTSVSDEKIEEYCEYGKDFDDERIKAETILAEKNIAIKLIAIEKEIVANDSIKKAIKHLKEGLANDKLDELSRAKALALSTRKTANEVAQQAFTNTPLQGSGEDAWRLMWEQARNYSITHAYQDNDFPFVTNGARCVLCQQELTAESASRLTSFETFVTAGLETTAKKAEEDFTTLIANIIQLPSIEDWIAHLTQLQFDQITAQAWYKSLNTRREQFLKCDAPEDLTVFDWSPIGQTLEQRAKDLLVVQTSLTQLQQDGQRQQLEKRVKQLKARQWLSQNKPAIFAERKRLAAVTLLDKAIKLTTTNSLTAKHTELGRTELNDGYQTRFNAELNALGGTRLPVTSNSKPQGKGVITFGLNLVGARQGYTPEVILSEGETRIIALAAFLADTTGSNQLAPFIFDDPISSLDQDFEERVVARLIELAKTRQVIIFTHRLSLVALVEDAIKKHGDNPANKKIGHIVHSLRRLGRTSGILAQQSLRDGKPDKATNAVRDHIIPKLKKLQTEADADGYDLHAKSACSDFRIILERTVEFILLNDVVIRFRREVKTKGKLRGIAKITLEDCDFLDDLMTKYSVYEHSQADELPQIPVELHEFERDVLELIAWISKFKERAA